MDRKQNGGQEYLLNISGLTAVSYTHLTLPTIGG